MVLHSLLFVSGMGKGLLEGPGTFEVPLPLWRVGLRRIRCKM